MPKQDVEPTLYFDVPPLRVEVYCAPGFRQVVAAMCYADEQVETHVATINALIERFSRGDRLSSEAFRQEPPGYAFRSGRVRFYGVYSDEKKGSFVLSHAIVKRTQKLGKSDVNEMSKCLKAFEAWAISRRDQ